MTWEAAILYAHQRMREIGKKPSQYHFEPVRISATQQEKTDGLIVLNAYNEIYIIVNPEKYYGVQIVSDNSTFDSDEARQTGAPEYTGLIRISRIATVWNLDLSNTKGTERAVPLEFLRVVIY